MTLITGDDGLPIVDLRFDSLRNLQEELGPYLALEGFFLRGETSVSPSDVIRFRMMLPGDFVLVEGAGVIIWVREADEAGPLDPVGAAVGFATLSEQGRELVERMVQTHIEGGGRQFDLSRPAVSESQEADPDATVALWPPEAKAEGKSAFRFTVRGEETQASSLADSTAEAPREKLEAPTGLDPEGPLVMDLPFEEAEPVVDPPFEPPFEPPSEPAPLASEPVEEKSTAVSAPSEETPGTALDDEEDPAPEEFESVAEFELVEGSAEEEERVGSGGEEPPSWSPPMAMPAEGVKPEIESADVTRDPPDIVTLPPQEEIQHPEMAAPVRGFDIDLPTDSDSDLRTAERMGAGEDGGYNDHFTINGELAGRPAGRRLGGLLGVLTVVVIAAGSWLVWQYFEGELPFWPLQKTPGTVATTAQIEAGSDQDAAGVILSEDDLEAAVSAAVEALSADENEGTTPSVEGSTKVEPLPAPAASSAPAIALKDVTWEMVDGGTLVVIRGDGLFDRARVRDDGLSAPPRILIRLRDIRVSYRPLEIPVGSPEINLIRLGHHPEKTPPSMWVVFDLADAGARVQSISTENDLVKILVGTS